MCISHDTNKCRTYKTALVFITRPRMGPSLGFATDVFFVCLWSCVTYYGLFYCTIGFVLHHWICIAPLDFHVALLEFNCTIGVVLRHCFSIRFEFQVIRKGCEGSGDNS